jgi:hypothetical protein
VSSRVNDEPERAESAPNACQPRVLLRRRSGIWISGSCFGRPQDCEEKSELAGAAVSWLGVRETGGELVTRGDHVWGDVRAGSAVSCLERSKAET